MIYAAWIEFNLRVEGLTGLSPGVWTAIVVGLCLVHHLTLPVLWRRLELRRRRALFRETHERLDAARAANLAHLEGFQHAMMRARTDAAVRSRPVGRSLQQGLDSHCIEELAKVYPDLGSVVDGQPGVHAPLDEAAIEKLLRFYSDELVLARREGRRPEPEACAEVDAEWLRYQRQVEAQQGLLERDYYALSAFELETENLGGAPTSQLLARVTVGALRRAHPLRLVRRALLGVFAATLAFALPFVLLAWRPGLGETAALLGLFAAWGTLNLALLLWWVVADWSVSWRGRAPDPQSFSEQRLQIEAMRIADQLGIAPPRLRIHQRGALQAFAAGRPSGPSLISVPEALVVGLSPDELRALIAHELGILRQDDARRRLTVRALLSPVELLLRLFGQATSALAVRVRHRVVVWVEGRYLVRRERPSLLFALLLVPCAAVALTAATVWLALKSVEGLLCRREDFEADHLAAAVCEDAALSSALDRSEALLAQLSVAASARLELRRMPGAPASPWQAPSAVLFSALCARFALRVGAGHPSLRSRLRALESGRPTLPEGLVAMARAGALALLSVGLLWGGVTSARLAADGSVGAVDTVRAWMADAGTQAPPDTPPPRTEGPGGAANSQPVVQPRAQRAFVRTRCHLREGPNRKTRSLTRLEAGSTCRVLTAGDRWQQLDCDGRRGYAHKVCLK